VAVPDGDGEREPVEGHRQEGRVADQVAEARAGEACRPLHVEAADLGVLPRLGQLRRLAEAAHLDRVLVAEAVRRRVVRRVRHLRERLLAGGLRLRELQLGALELLLDRAQLLELLRRRLALGLRAPAQLVHARDELPPALVRGEPGVERLGRSLTGKPAAEVLRVGARGAGVDHARESR
jgi:hypothetical protein